MGFFNKGFQKMDEDTYFDENTGTIQYNTPSGSIVDNTPWYDGLWNGTKDILGTASNIIPSMMGGNGVAGLLYNPYERKTTTTVNDLSAKNSIKWFIIGGAVIMGFVALTFVMRRKA